MLNFDFIFKQAWVIFILVGVANYFLLKQQVQEKIEKNPALEEGCRKIILRMFIYGNIPWLIMGIGSLTSLSENMFDYFNPRSLNPIVLLFHAYILVIWVLLVRYIYFKNGAETLVDYPGIIRFNGNSSLPTPWSIKVFFAIALTGGIMGMLCMWFSDFSLIHFPK